MNPFSCTVLMTMNGVTWFVIDNEIVPLFAIMPGSTRMPPTSHPKRFSALHAIPGYNSSACRSLRAAILYADDMETPWFDPARQSGDGLAPAFQELRQPRHA